MVREVVWLVKHNIAVLLSIKLAVRQHEGVLHNEYLEA